MSEILERVIRAIDEAGMAFLKADTFHSAGWADIPTEVFARAALEAIKVPTDGMIEVGLSVSKTTGSIKEIWEAMIQEALR